MTNVVLKLVTLLVTFLLVNGAVVHSNGAKKFGPNSEGKFLTYLIDPNNVYETQTIYYRCVGKQPCTQ